MIDIPIHQVKMIKARLEEELGKMHKVAVGSTEQFQGQEKEAMVLTTARSSLTCMKEGTGERANDVCHFIS